MATKDDQKDCQQDKLVHNWIWEATIQDGGAKQRHYVRDSVIPEGYNVDLYDWRRLSDLVSTGDTVSVDTIESKQITMEVGAMQTAGQMELEELGPGARHRALFLEKIQHSNEAIQSGDFQTAVKLYTEAIQLDPTNHILYSNRSAAYIKLHQYKKGLEDAQKSRDLNPRWSKHENPLNNKALPCRSMNYYVFNEKFLDAVN
ncbi:uncharacterized protein LOC135477004 [Liolophura sinensis]|uniref:uncharacterized protein LOC135477004 n=1 Tax=Liolophura sinensis TaxID=3198878 RepID=UPI003158BBDE